MKLKAVVAALKPFLAADKKPADVIAAILAADKGAKDEAKKAAYDKARDSMSAKDKKAFDAMSDEEKDKYMSKDRDDSDPEGTNAEDEDLDPEHTNDRDPDAEDEEVEAEDNDLDDAEPNTASKGGAAKKPAKDKKGAMDSATVNKLIEAAVAKRDATHAAALEVEPIVGRQAFDSAGAAYKAALDALGVDLTDIPTSAYRAVLNLAKTSRTSAPAAVAMDAAGAEEVLKRIPNLNRL